MAKGSINPTSNSRNRSSSTLSNGHSAANPSSPPKSLREVSPTQMDGPLVGIIGAGVSGLRAAEVLLEKGYRVTIFEARNRYGGRVCTSNVLGKDVDLGPNWVHGTLDNPIVPLTQIARSTLHSFSDNCPVWGPSGALLNNKETDELQNMLWNTVEEATEYSKTNCANIPAEKSFYDYCAEKADEIFHDGPTPSNLCNSELDGNQSDQITNGSSKKSEEHVKWKGAAEKKAIWLAMAEFWGSFIGTSVRKQSLKYFYLEEPIEGDNLFVASTYKPILETVAELPKEAGAIHLNTPITSISSSRGTTEGKSVVLATSSGQTVEVDAVVVTTPLGCLKQNTIKFTPPLPTRIQAAIGSLSYGHLEKIYVKFPKAFWKSEQGPDLFQFLTPEYASKTNLGRWHMCCFSLANLEEPYSQPTLLFYVFGDASAHVTKFAPFDTDEGRKQRIEFLEPYFSRLPGYDAEKVECTPEKFLATSWSNDPWSGNGSYSNFQVGLEDGEEDIAALRNGMPDKRIWFAGEHTAPILGLGSISGAHWSGTGAAERVIAALEGTNARLPN